MIHALLDAASLASNGQPSQSNPWLGPLGRLLESLSDGLIGEPSKTAEPLLQAVAEALDVEIARWEERARDDGEARAVLRAFLGLRELLWEFGLRRAAPAETRVETRPRPAAKAKPQRNQPRARPNAVQG